MQTDKSINVEHKTTYDTGLCAWGYTQFCVMESSGDVIFSGKEKEDDPAALHIYSFKNGWDKVGTKKVPCNHEQFYIFPITIENNEILLVSCWQCEVVWFFDTHNGLFNEALRQKGVYPLAMCKTEGDYVYIVNKVKGCKTILKAKCTPTKLIVDKIKTIHSGMEHVPYMHYLPDEKSLVGSRWKGRIVKAFNCKTLEQVWEVKGEVGGVTWKPHGLFYSPEHQSLLVCDVGRFVVLNPNDGSVLQVIPLSIPGRPISLSIREGRMMLHNTSSMAENISVFTIE